MLTQNRDQTRQFFITVWQKYQQQQALHGVEALVRDVILQHPEYHQHLTQQALQHDFAIENGQMNPFLHMGLHIALREQINTNRPVGVQSVYQRLLLTQGNTHQVEHLMLDCLAETLWQAQRTNQLPDEQAYLNCLHQQG